MAAKKVDIMEIRQLLLLDIPVILTPSGFDIKLRGCLQHHQYQYISPTQTPYPISYALIMSLNFCLILSQAI